MAETHSNGYVYDKLPEKKKIMCNTSNALYNYNTYSYTC